MIIILILTLSILLQFGAAVMAFRLIPITGRRIAWSLIAAALLFMGVRRCVPLFRMLSGDTTFRPDFTAELLALVISLLVVIGISMIAPIFTDRKRAEEKLQYSKAFLDNIIDHSPHAMWISDDKGTLVRLNQACCDLLHIKADEIVGKYNVLKDTIVAEQGHLPLVKRVFEQGETAKFTIEYDSERLKNLELRERVSVVLDVTISPVLDAGGRVTHAIIQHVDITNRRRAEEALLESAEKYRLIAENTADLISIMDMNLRFTYISPSIMRIRGLTIEEAMGQTLDQIMTPESLQIALAAFEEEMKLEASGTADPDRIRVMELEEYKKNGALVWLEIGLSYLRDKDGKPIAILAVSRDITDRKQTLKALARSEENFHEEHKFNKLLLDTSPALIVAIGIDGKILMMNQALLDILEYSIDEIKGADYMTTFVPEEDRGTLAPIFQQIIREGKATVNENWIRSKSGKTYLVEWHGGPVIREGGDVDFFVGVGIDITERKRAEEALTEKDKFMESIIQSSAVATFVVNAEHKVIYWNRACEDLTGMKSDDLLGTRDHWKAFYDHPRQCVADIIIENKFNEMTNLYEVYTKSLLIPDGIRAEGWYLNLGGKNRYIVFDAAPIRDNNGNLIAAIETLQDITERKQAEEQLQDTLESLRKAVGATIQVMVSAVEVRDPYTAGHQIRSADLARAIATEMGLSHDRIEGLRMAGSIHDIGKLSVPAEILSKPTKLTNIEFSLIKEHARQGYEMLKDVESSWPLAEIVYQHHERMDGSGYPRNLKGDDILMEARILTVADVVESMASHRPYRPALGIEAALNEIEKNRGILYDDAVADACLRLFREKVYKLEGT